MMSRVHVHVPARGTLSAHASNSRLLANWGSLVILALFSLGAVTSAWAAGTYYVGSSSPTCSNSGPGTPTNPYCTISAAVTAHNGSGTTIVVMLGVYPEQVTVPSSGSSGNPFVLQAAGPGVMIDGSDDFFSTRSWSCPSAPPPRSPHGVHTLFRVISTGRPQGLGRPDAPVDTVHDGRG